MSDGDSVTRWIEGLLDGDDADIGRLWDRYFEALVRLAGTRLGGRARRDYDEEDVALSAFRSFCERAERGDFPRLGGRDDLWRLLSTIAVRKAIESVRHQNRQKRGGGRVRGESVLGQPGEGGAGLAGILGREPTPEAAAQFAESYERLLARLGDDALRRIAVRKLEGHSNEEIATELGTSPRTVERKLKLIRKTWQEEIAA